MDARIGQMGIANHSGIVGVAELNYGSSEKLIRILLVDEERIVRKGLRLLIEQQPGLTVVGEASDRAEALEMVAREQPDIVLLEFLENQSGCEIVQELLSAARNTKVIMLTSRRDLKSHHQAMLLGAQGVVPKYEAPEVLIKAILKVTAGEIWVQRSTAASILAEMLCTLRGQKNDPEAYKIATLTRREREVVVLIGKGLKNKQIGCRLFISEATVSHHLTSIFNKLDVPDRLQLIVYAYQNHLVETNVLS